MTKAGKYQMIRSEDDPLLNLFDTGERDHVCNLIANADRTLDLMPLLRCIDEYVKRLFDTGRGQGASEYGAAIRLRDCVESVSLILATHDSGETRDISGLLNDAWTRFIADAGAYRMYHDLPQEHASRKRGGRNRRTTESTLLERVYLMLSPGKEDLSATRFVSLARERGILELAMRDNQGTPERLWRFHIDNKTPVDVARNSKTLNSLLRTVKKSLGIT